MAAPVWSVALVGAALTVAACGSGGGSPSPSGGSSAPSPSSSSPAASSALPAPIIDPIVADAAARMDVDPTTVVVVLAGPRTFGDGSLGCPEPGMVYIQVVTDGYQVVVDAGETRLDYRGTGPGAFRLCTTASS